MSADWLDGAERACNDAVAATDGRVDVDQLLRIAEVHALVDIARSLRTISALIDAAPEEEAAG